MSELFKVQKNSKRILWPALVAMICLIFFVSFYYFRTHHTFLKYSNENFYTPLDSNGMGFTGKVNEILQNALNDTNVNVRFDIENLNNGFYNRLSFYYPLDTSNYLVSIDDIRLDNIIPANRDEAIFIQNSYLKDALDKQRKYRNRQIFRVFTDRKTGFRIKSITVDPSLYKAKLSSSEWQGEIIFPDPFKVIDSNSVFLVFQEGFFPIFSSSDTSFYVTRNEYKILHQGNAFYKFVPGVINQQPFNLTTDLISCYDSLSIKNKPLKMILGVEQHNNAEPQSLRIKNLRTHLELFFNDIDSGRIYYNSGADSTITNGRRIRISNSILPVQIAYRDRGKACDFIITKKSPLSFGSKPKNAFASDDRTHLNDAYTDLFTRQLLAGLENTLTKSDKAINLELSINPLLSKYLEDEIKTYITSVKAEVSDPAFQDDVYEISICLVDNKTGEIIAAPFYSTEFEFSPKNELTERKNFNFTKHFIGSTFKPLIANAAAIKFPSLERFQLTVPSQGTSANRVGNNCSVLGFPIYPIPFGYDRRSNSLNSLFWVANHLERYQFLNQSHDLYPIALSMLALTEPDDTAFYTLINRNANILSFNNLFQLNLNASTQRLFVEHNIHPTTSIVNFKNSSFCDLISQLYNIELDNIYDKELQSFEKAYDTAYFKSSIYQKGLKSDLLLPEMVSLNVDILGSDNLRGANRRNFSDFSSWVLGQGLNELNNLKLAEAYARLFSKRSVSLSFWHNNINVDNNHLFPLLSNSILFNDNRIQHTSAEINNTWSSFLTNFHFAQSHGNNRNLLPPAVTSLETAKNLLRTQYGINVDSLCIVGKTGTPDEFGRNESKKLFWLDREMYYDEGLYVFGLLNHQNYNSLTRVSGISGVIYIKHISRNLELARPEVDGVKSRHARDFLSPGRLGNIIFLTKNKYQP